jgi:hypothetical protein
VAVGAKAVAVVLAEAVVVVAEAVVQTRCSLRF